MTKDEIMLSKLEDLSSNIKDIKKDVRDIRIELKDHGESLVRLESNSNAIIQRVSSLEKFKDWSVRFSIGSLITLGLTFAVILFKGCV